MLCAFGFVYVFMVGLHVFVVVDCKSDHHICLVCIKLGIEAHKFHPNSQNSLQSQSATIPTTQIYFKTLKMYKTQDSNAKIAKWKSYSICSCQCRAPTLTLEKLARASRVSAKRPRFKRNSCHESANLLLNTCIQSIQTHGSKRLNHRRRRVERDAWRAQMKISRISLSTRDGRPPFEQQEQQ